MNERCDARRYPLNRTNKMKMNDADRERVLKRQKNQQFAARFSSPGKYE